MLSPNEQCPSIEARSVCQRGRVVPITCPFPNKTVRDHWLEVDAFKFFPKQHIVTKYWLRRCSRDVRYPRPMSQRLLDRAIPAPFPHCLEQARCKRRDRAIWDQESIQNLADAPSPRRTLTDALNIASTFFSALDGRRAQAEEVSVCLSHSHLSHSANPSSFRSGMPSPPWSLGE